MSTPKHILQRGKVSKAQVSEALYLDITAQTLPDLRRILQSCLNQSEVVLFYNSEGNDDPRPLCEIPEIRATIQAACEQHGLLGFLYHQSRDSGPFQQHTLYNIAEVELTCCSKLESSGQDGVGTFLLDTKAAKILTETSKNMFWAMYNY